MLLPMREELHVSGTELEQSEVNARIQLLTLVLVKMTLVLGLNAA